MRNLGNPFIRGTDGVPVTRRAAIAAAAAGIASLVAPVRAGATEEPFKFGLTPVFLSNDLELLGHLRTYLASKIGGSVELVTRRTYQEITALLVSGQIQSAWICGYPYVQFKADLDLVAHHQAEASTGRRVGEVVRRLDDRHVVDVRVRAGLE